MKPDFIITSDIHARESNPISRIDNYFEALKRKILWLGEVQRSHGGIPIIDGGDLFDSWKSTPMVESWLIENLPQPFFTVIGNHEMPDHNVNHFPKSSLNVLIKADKVILLDYSHQGVGRGAFVSGINYGQINKTEFPDKPKQEKWILLIHEMVTQEKTELFDSSIPKEMLDKFPQFDMIICGHNHKRFDYIKDGRYFLSPGSLMRSSIDQIDYHPCIHLVDVSKGEFERVEVPIDSDVFDIQQIEIRKKKDERIQNFVNSFSTDYSIDVSFEKNMERFCRANKIRNGIKEEITIAMEEMNG